MGRHLSPCLSLFCIAAAIACGETVGPDAATLIVANQSSDKVTVYFSNCSEETWGGSRGTVGAGDEKSWRVDPGCWDIKAAWEPSCYSETRGQLLGPNGSFRFAVQEPEPGFCD